MTLTRSILAIITGSLLSIINGSEIEDRLPDVGIGKVWKLVWADEFNGPGLDPNRWDIPEYKRRDAYWTKRAILLDGKGHLIIRAFQEGTNFYNGCIRTRSKFEQAFGYFVAKIRFQRQTGHWTAFWLYNDSVQRIGDEGRDGTEIDIVEKPWIDDFLQHTLHWDGYGKEHKSVGKRVRVAGIMEGFHTFGLLWTPDGYVFFVDGKITWETKAGGVCQVPLYIKLSDEIEFNSWAGDIKEHNFSDELVVDYVRVYDLFYESDGKAIWTSARRLGIEKYLPSKVR